jgi:hypothetical protein
MIRHLRASGGPRVHRAFWAMDKGRRAAWVLSAFADGATMTVKMAGTTARTGRGGTIAKVR